jgi:hypothetical protein
MGQPEQDTPAVRRLEQRWQWRESGGKRKRKKIPTSGSHKKVYKITQIGYI